MSQFKIYGHATFLGPRISEVSEALHGAAVRGLGIPESKRFHRFFPMEEGTFIAPDDRSKAYLVIECVLFAGRSVETKKAFYRVLLEELASCGVDAADVELTFIETPRHDWLIRGKPGDELELTYRVEG